MAETKARHAHGSSSNVDSAIAAGTINAFDVLFLDSDTDPKIGWVTKEGKKIILEDKAQIVRVDSLPTADGDENVVYLYNNEGFVWDGIQCVPMAKSADLTNLETQVTTLKTQMDEKVDKTTVENMIDSAVEASAGEVIEF